MMNRVIRVGALAAAAAILLAACANRRGADLTSPVPPSARGDLSAGAPPAGSAAAVNRYLWAAALETLDFLPLDFADPYGGLITTDWYANPEAPAERFRATVYILDSRLRADALRVSVFKQTFRDGVGWVDAPVAHATEAEIENSILTRARELRLDSLDAN